MDLGWLPISKRPSFLRWREELTAADEEEGNFITQTVKGKPGVRWPNFDDSIRELAKLRTHDVDKEWLWIWNEWKPDILVFK